MRGVTPLTGTGAGLATVAVAAYAAGALLGYPVLVALAVGGLTLLAVGACAVTVRPPVALARRLSTQRITVGDETHGTIEVRNTARRPSVPFTAVERIDGESIALEVGALAPGGRLALSYPVTGRRRGHIPLGPLTMERRDPFGLFRRAKRQTGDGVLWVRPRVHPMRAMPVGVVLDYDGRVDEHARAGTITFSSLRDYVPGDDPRQIHWRSTARLGSMVVRERMDTTEPTTTVVLDVRSGVYGGDSFEHAVEVAASAVRAVEAAGRPVALRVPGERLADSRAAGAVCDIDRLTLAGPLPGADLTGLLTAVERGASGGALIVITGHADAATLAGLAARGRRFRPVVVVSLRDDGAGTDVGHRTGLAVISARSAQEAVARWNLMVRGGPR
jgi:uncharacterized protein (DUF58 family)